MSKGSLRQSSTKEIEQYFVRVRDGDDSLVSLLPPFRRVGGGAARVARGRFVGITT